MNKNILLIILLYDLAMGRESNGLLIEMAKEKIKELKTKSAIIQLWNPKRRPRLRRRYQAVGLVFHGAPSSLKRGVRWDDISQSIFRLKAAALGTIPSHLACIHAILEACAPAGNPPHWASHFSGSHGCKRDRVPSRLETSE